MSNSDQGDQCQDRRGILLACIAEAGDDVEAAFSAFEYITTNKLDTSMSRPDRNGAARQQCHALPAQEVIASKVPTGRKPSTRVERRPSKNKAAVKVSKKAKRRSLFRSLRVKKRWAPARSTALAVVQGTRGGEDAERNKLIAEIMVALFGKDAV